MRVDGRTYQRELQSAELIEIVPTDTCTSSSLGGSFFLRSRCQGESNGHAPAKHRREDCYHRAIPDKPNEDDQVDRKKASKTRRDHDQLQSAHFVHFCEHFRYRRSRLTGLVWLLKTACSSVQVDETSKPVRAHRRADRHFD